MTADALFERVSSRLVELHDDLERGRILHSTGVKANGRFCAFVTRGDLVVKLPSMRVAELVATGAGEPFDAGKGRPMKEWVRLPPSDEATMTAYVLEARDFVGSPAGRPRT